MALPSTRARTRPPRARRAAVPALGCVSALLLSACGPGEEEQPSFTDQGYPVAPPQEIAAADPAHEDVALVPIGQLADAAWLAETAERTGIPERVLAAYAGASIRLDETHPDCGIGWNTLAGIGAVESVHGQIDGSQTDEDGQVEPPIIGIPLDGSDGVLEIPDTDGGELDEDTEWDRAVGPMQFIPTTWEENAQDGNLDGVSDPHQIDDAVLTAALYLCGQGGDLTDDDGWNSAITAYNLPQFYARDVAEHATGYVE
ncbi:lytic transglycosylase domain-containing protein [Gulosibacter sp. 10]|uniref:lytic transglycosylase domain-containing protein n=1 Tax=Gulosibacter sp. 10 TaxID=1255570 RepID=UPI00097F33AC|nr:lytic murein transglycosylase [Gulosibacter sp. 10]SJM65078.1 hypothetical protein FM112_10615 [Gulosibacter sp. 10]